MGVYTKMAQNYLRLPENTVGDVITKDKFTYKSLKEKIDNYYENICKLFNEIKILLTEVQTNLTYEKYIAYTIGEVREKKVEFDNKYNETKRNFNEKCNLLLYLYHGLGFNNNNLDKTIIEFSNFIEKKLKKNK